MITWGWPKDRPENRRSIRLLGWTNLAFTRLYHDVKVLATPEIPNTGPGILVCNHTSGLDPLLLQSCFERLIVWMMAKEYHDLKMLGWVYRTIEAIPVTRSGRDMSATRAALRALAAGRILGVFPEGKIETSRQLLPFQTGVALLAIKSRAPVYPAWLDGEQRGKEMVHAFAWPNRATVRFGPEVQFDRDATDKEALHAATDKITQAVANLAAQSGTPLDRLSTRPTPSASPSV